MRVAGATGAAGPRPDFTACAALSAKVGGRNAQQLQQPLPAAGFAHRRLGAADQQLLFALAVGTDEFVKWHGRVVGSRQWAVDESSVGRGSFKTRLWLGASGLLKLISPNVLQAVEESHLQ
jgi:hypothetical protein